MECFIFKGFNGFYGGILMIFDGMKSGEMLDFPMFYRSHYRTQNGNRRVDRRDMPVCLANKRSKNVNHAPLWYENIL